MYLFGSRLGKRINLIKINGKLSFHQTADRRWWALVLAMKSVTENENRYRCRVLQRYGSRNAIASCQTVADGCVKPDKRLLKSQPLVITTFLGIFTTAPAHLLTKRFLCAICMPFSFKHRFLLEMRITNCYQIVVQLPFLLFFFIIAIILRFTAVSLSLSLCLAALPDSFEQKLIFTNSLFIAALDHFYSKMSKEEEGEEEEKPFFLLCALQLTLWLRRMLAIY